MECSPSLQWFITCRPGYRLAVLIFRFVENQRKRPEGAGLPEFLPYASHFLAMVVGWFFLVSRKMDLTDVTHRNFKELSTEFDTVKMNLYKMAINSLKMALNKLYGEKKISLQQLSATFRRGDLLNDLDKAMSRI